MRKWLELMKDFGHYIIHLGDVSSRDYHGCIWINIHGLSTSSTKLISELFAKRLL